MNRIADLTWRRPSSSSPPSASSRWSRSRSATTSRAPEGGRLHRQRFRERARTRRLRDALGYDANPGMSVVVRFPGGGKLDSRQPLVRRRSAGSAPRRARVEVRRPVVPAARPPRRPRPDRPRRRSLVVAAYLSTDDIEDAGGCAAEDVSAAGRRSRSTSRWAATRRASTRSTTRPART